MDPVLFDAQLAALAVKLRTLTTSDEHLDAMEAFDRFRGSAPARFNRVVDGETNNQPTDQDVQDQARRLASTLSEGGVEHQTFVRFAELQHGRQAPKVATLPWMPCANVSPKLVECKEKGKLVCSACGLVLYCSKDCQAAHWKQHRADCKDPLRAKDWQPKYMREHRDPDFLNMPPKDEWLKRREGFVEHLWGGVPAVDILNLSMNEGKSSTQDLSLAFVASGDIANLVKTVNSLPDDYSGNLTLVLNDFSPFLAGRNFLLLLLLGTMPDADMSAELALHLWYSAFLPEYSSFKMSLAFSAWTDTFGWVEGSQTLAGGKSILHSHMGRKPLDLLSYMIVSNPTVVGPDPNRDTYDDSDAKNEFSKAMSPVFNLDDHERQLAGVHPSHRVALNAYRRTGIVLPFGATRSWFNVPNRFLFSPDVGKWLQDDTVSPLHAWNIDDVLDAKAHGARSDDVIGSLYFYLADELRNFSNRLRRFKISIHLFSLPPLELARSLAAGNFASAGLPPTFDRIDIGESIDVAQVETGEMLEAWGPKLSSTNPHAAIVGLSRSWYLNVVGGRPGPGDESLVEELAESGRLGNDVTEEMLRPEELQRNPEILRMPRYLETMRENGTTFRRWLEDEGVDAAAKKGGVKLKSRNSILPSRILAPLGGANTALPVFESDEEWYRWTKLTNVAFSERYFEFAKA